MVNYSERILENTMKTNGKNDSDANPGSLSTVCLDSCQRLLSQIEKVKRVVLREFGASVAGNRRFLELGINEAEALAWQTAYPHLLFPVLAEEKAVAVGQWAARQRAIKRAGLTFSQRSYRRQSVCD